MTTTIDQQTEFFERFKAFMGSAGETMAQESLQQYGSVLRRFTIARDEAMEAERMVASSYNLFSILKLHFSEVRLHTPILANLLNPLGTHAQGLLFYKHFINVCLKSNPLPGALDVREHDLYVKDEVVTKQGNIDILIHSRKQGNPFAIVVENKIWAADQYLQLYRYFTYATQELGIAPERIRLVYLTPSGKEPSYEGLTPEQAETIKNVLVRVRYNPHIAEVLTRALDPGELKADVVRYTIQQYLQTINTVLS